MMRSQDRDRLKDLEELLLDEYKENKVEKKRNWQIYEQQLMNRIKGAIKNLDLLIDGAINFETQEGLESKMYVVYGMSLKSEKEAFDRAMEMLKKNRCRDQ